MYSVQEVGQFTSQILSYVYYNDTKIGNKYQ